MLRPFLDPPSVRSSIEPSGDALSRPAHVLLLRRLPRVGHRRELIYNEVSSSAFEKLVAHLAEEVAPHRLGAVRVKPGRVVAWRAPAASVSGGPAVRDPKQRQAVVLAGLQGVLLAGRRAVP